ncbi:hypothetical protein LG275_03855 [Chryseomicrobium palamuruense]
MMWTIALVVAAYFIGWIANSLHSEKSYYHGYNKGYSDCTLDLAEELRKNEDELPGK